MSNHRVPIVNCAVPCHFSSLRNSDNHTGSCMEGPIEEIKRNPSSRILDLEWLKRRESIVIHPECSSPMQSSPSVTSVLHWSGAKCAQQQPSPSPLPSFWKRPTNKAAACEGSRKWTAGPASRNYVQTIHTNYKLWFTYWKLRFPTHYIIEDISTYLHCQTPHQPARFHFDSNIGPAQQGPGACRTRHPSSLQRHKYIRTERWMTVVFFPI